MPPWRIIDGLIDGTTGIGKKKGNRAAGRWSKRGMMLVVVRAAYASTS
jgi:hypothetical protein